MKKVLLSVVLSAGLLAASVSLADATSDWGDAIAIPDLVALNIGGEAEGRSVSCSSAGNCAATGYYYYEDGNSQGFVVNQIDGEWGTAIPIPGLVELNSGGYAGGRSVSCSSDGNCAVTGYYTDEDGQQGFVVNQTGGTWDDAIPIPGLGTLNLGGSAQGLSVSCSSAGNCAVTGVYLDGASYQGFVVNQTDGTWDDAIAIPGLVDLNDGGEAAGNSVSCSSDGNCAVTGYYFTGTGLQGFVVNQIDGGEWDGAIPIPNLIALNTGGQAQGLSVSCSSDGNCSVTGYYYYYDGDYQGFVVNQTAGEEWDDAIAIPGLIDLNTGGEAVGTSVSCSSAGNCAVTGYYNDADDNYQGFVVNQIDGTWDDAIAIPGLVELNSGSAQGLSVSCSSDGNCAVTGHYYDDGRQGFVVNQTAGEEWDDAIPIPNLIALNTGDEAQGNSVSCSSDGNCAVTGYYYDEDENSQGFVVNLDVSPVPPTTTTTTTTVPPTTTTTTTTTVPPVNPVVLTFTG